MENLEGLLNVARVFGGLIVLSVPAALALVTFFMYIDAQNMGFKDGKSFIKYMWGASTKIPIRELLKKDGKEIDRKYGLNKYLI